MIFLNVWMKLHKKFFLLPEITVRFALVNISMCLRYPSCENNIQWLQSTGESTLHCVDNLSTKYLHLFTISTITWILHPHSLQTDISKEDYFLKPSEIECNECSVLGTIGNILHFVRNSCHEAFRLDRLYIGQKNWVSYRSVAYWYKTCKKWAEHNKKL